MDLVEFLKSLEPRAALAGSLVLSILLYSISANVGWAAIAPRGARFGRLVAWMRRFRLRTMLFEFVRLLYYIVLPWLTLILGYNTMRALGVWNLDWLMNWWIALVVTFGGAPIFIWVWKPYAQSEHPEAVDLSRWNGARQILEAIYQELHWAFYRSGPILWLGDFYWGSFTGLSLSLIEGWTNPMVRANVRDITRADAPLWAGSLAIISVLVFYYTQNTWYCLLIHLGLNFILRRLIGLDKAGGFLRERITNRLDETYYEESTYEE